MSKHRRTVRQENTPLGNFDIFNNINFKQVVDFLNNTDIEEIASMLSGGNKTGENGESIDNSKVQMLSSIKTLINSDKKELVELMIQVYFISSMLKKSNGNK